MFCQTDSATPTMCMRASSVMHALVYCQPPQLIRAVSHS
jgi:hypothetical protein